MTGTRWLAVGVVMTVMAAVTARAGWSQAPAAGGQGQGVGVSGDTGLSRHASHEGSYWQALSGKEKDAYVRAFLAGALSDQVTRIALAERRSAGSVQDSLQDSVRDKIVDSLRASHAVRFPFTPTVYVAQLDDFYWWQDRMAVPVDEALNRINAQMEAQQSRP